LVDRRVLVCAAYPYGYGPVAKILALAPLLRRDGPVAFVGTGSALELATREADVFDEVVAGPLDGPEGRALLARSWGVLSAMDRDAAVAADGAGLPLFVVDSLLWMRRETPEALRGASEYWAQAFPGFDPGRLGPRGSVVGPLVAPRPDAGAAREGLVVHLGGSAAPEGPDERHAEYARLVLRALLATGLLDRFGRATVIGGGPALAALGERESHPLVETVAAGARDARRRLSHAAALLTSPGLTATLEAFHDGTPTWFLPPQNHSQCILLRRLRAAGLAGDSFHWEDFAGSARLDDALPASGRDPAAADAVFRGIRHPAATAALATSLARVGVEARSLAARQASFFASLGPSGLEAVADGLRRRRELAARPPASARAAPSHRPPPEDPVKTVSFSLLRGVCQTPAYVAHDRGFFAEQGLEARIDVAPTAWVVPQRLAKGDVDFAVLPWTRVATARASGEDLVAICGSGIEEAALVVRPDLDLERVRSVAVPHEGGMKDLTAAGLMRALGLGPEAAVRLPSGDAAVVAYVGGAADAAVMVEPYAAMLEARGLGRVARRTGDLWPGAPGCSLATSRRQVEERPDLVRAVVRAYVRGAEHVRSNPDDAAEVAARWIGVAPDVVRRAFRSNRPDVRALHNAEAMDRVLDLMASLGYVRRKPTGFVDLTFLDEALAAAARR
jgi:ABC-type nitrate/sulfonate/bicarbonate transport system substrate-binding protein